MKDWLENIHNIGLVLEGGGMRGVFTCGVLDYLMDHQVEFPYTIGVSAGACNGLSYISKQRGRAKTSNIDVLEKYKYIGYRYLFTQRNIMDFNLMFHDIPEHILPYDYKAYFASPQRYEMVTTNCVTGEANYFEEKTSDKRVIDIARASSSLPFVCPIAYVDSTPMLDGGICDSIPIKRAISEGYEKNVVVLTRQKGYRKNAKKVKVPSLVYRRYPKLRLALENRNSMYNAQLALVEKLEDEGRVLVIRPEVEVKVDRIEKNVTKLKALYEQGYTSAKNILSLQEENRFVK